MEKFVINGSVDSLYFSTRRIENVVVLLGVLEKTDLSSIPDGEMNCVFGLLYDVLGEAYDVQAEWVARGIEIH